MTEQESKQQIEDLKTLHYELNVINTILIVSQSFKDDPILKHRLEILRAMFKLKLAKAK